MQQHQQVDHQVKVDTITEQIDALRRRLRKGQRALQQLQTQLAKHQAALEAQQARAAERRARVEAAHSPRKVPQRPRQQREDIAALMRQTHGVV